MYFQQRKLRRWLNSAECSFHLCLCNLVPWWCGNRVCFSSLRYFWVSLLFCLTIRRRMCARFCVLTYDTQVIWSELETKFAWNLSRICFPHALSCTASWCFCMIIGMFVLPLVPWFFLNYVCGTTFFSLHCFCLWLYDSRNHLCDAQIQNTSHCDLKS